MPITSSQLQDYIDSKIKLNGKKSISGPVMNQALTMMRQFIDERSVEASTLNINNTDIINGVNGRILFQSLLGKLSQSSMLYWQDLQGRLSIGAGNSPTAKLQIRAQGGLTSDQVLGLQNSTGTASIFRINGDSSFESIKSIYAGLKFEYKNNYTPTLRIGAEWGQSEAAILQNWRDNYMGDWLFKNALTFYQSTLADGNMGSNNMNFVCNLSHYHEADNAGLNGFFWYNPPMGTPIESVNRSHLTAYLSYLKTFALFNSQVSNPEDSARSDSFQIYANDISGSSTFHIRNENGDIIKLYKQDWSSVSDIAGIIEKLKNLGL